MHHRLSGRVIATAVGAALLALPMAAQQGGRPGGAGAGAAAGAGGFGGFGAQQAQNRVDSSLYVRTTMPSDPNIIKLWDEGVNRSQAMKLAQVLLDSIGPRLNNSDRCDAGQDWMSRMYQRWGVSAKKVQYGTWVKWVRGTTHVDLIAPRVRSLEAVALGWSPSTNGAVEADVIVMPALTTPQEFQRWAPTAKGKFILASAPNPSCRSASQWVEFGADGSRARVDSIRRAWASGWNDRMIQGGNPKEWPKQIGVAGMLTTNWSQYPGINKVFGSPRDQVPTLDISCEDYNLLYRLASNNQGPKVRVNAESRNLGEQPVHNLIAEIKGSSKANEYIILSAHYDSWDGASGATDNGTGTLTMMEAMRILKAVYPNPRRTIIAGHWGGEEQGLNGSRAWVEDNPDIVARVHAGFNQDNGTGRIVSGGPGPFVGGTDAWIRYLRALPRDFTLGFRLTNPGGPASGGTDNAAFQCAKSPVYGTSGLSWDYGNTTWHTNRDTNDKVVQEDLIHNATMIAMLVYMADQDEQMLSREVLTKMPGTEREITYSCPLATRKTSDSNR